MGKMAHEKITKKRSARSPLAPSLFLLYFASPSFFVAPQLTERLVKAIPSIALNGYTNCERLVKAITSVALSGY